MIGRITGILLEKNPPQLLLDVQGVGYEVDVPMSTFYNLPALNERVVLHTQLIVREDAHLLFGFGSLDERTAFRQLLKISGVGPKLALSVLSGLSLVDLADAVARKETGRLTKIPGVGKKTAERLLLELEGKFAALPVSGNTAGADAAQLDSDITNALQALGYSAKEADWAAKQLPADISVSDGIRQALKYLSKA
ncbi:Holliday junction branch migration protein RuvA [Ferriphaselus sp. R-1]|uniref:Holliday junction branch migration protein RuvA n=1 Tax=Ferriphaselus sp. R-1 TaxID=1485544 RepID=UPI000559997C|nr:Holliday junction branch migration protein RuvA [Ferriphaselus sp. R-1]